MKWLDPKYDLSINEHSDALIVTLHPRQRRIDLCTAAVLILIAVLCLLKGANAVGLILLAIGIPALWRWLCNRPVVISIHQDAIRTGSHTYPWNNIRALEYYIPSPNEDASAGLYVRVGSANIMECLSTDITLADAQHVISLIYAKFPAMATEHDEPATTHTFIVPSISLN